MTSATLLYRSKLQKPPEQRLTSQAIAQRFNQLHGTTISHRSVRQNVQLGWIGKGMKKNGRQLTFCAPELFPYLVMAYRTYIELMQLNGKHEVKLGDMSIKIQAAL